MAHTVRPDDSTHRLPRINGAEDVCIDLRHGDLSDEAVVSVLLELARERAAAADRPTVLDEAARGPAHLTTYAQDEPRRRWWPLALGGGVALLVVVLMAVAVRSQPGPVVDTDGAEAAAAASGRAAGDRDGATRPSPPSTRAAVDPSPDRAARPVTTRGEAARTAAFCQAVRTYTLDDLPTLAEHGVRDPRGTIDAYAAMVANAPPEIADDVTALGPITGKVQTQIETGAITTPEQMQQYLAGGAPADEIGRWIAAQQAIVAELPRLCPDHPGPTAP